MGIKQKLIITSTAIKLFILGSQFLVDALYPDYDQSTDLLFEEGKMSKIDSVLKVTARWDSLFFLKIAQKGYEYEKNHAFFETYPKFLNMMNGILQMWVKTEAITGLLLSGLILNLVLNGVNTILLHEITKLKFPQMSSKFYYAVCLIYQFSPSSAFYNGIYSESLFSFLIFTYLFLFYRGYYAIPADQRGVKLFYSFSNFSFSFMASVVLSTSVFVRSNGLFWVVVVGYPILEAFIKNLLAINDGKFSLRVMFNAIAWGVLNIVLVTIPYILVLKKAEQVYCSASYFEEKASWCQGVLPNVYSFIQDKHWNVGFLTYYKLSRMCFIIWGLYTFLLISSYILKYVKSLFKQQNSLNIFSNGELHSQMLYTTILFFISVFFAHSQSSTRFFSSDPNLYWFLADILFNHNAKSSTKNILPKLLSITYLVHFNIAGIFLYSNYLIWT